MSASLSTEYLGLSLKNPLVISACPVTNDLDKLRELEQAGAAAAVLPSLFEEQIEHDDVDMSDVQDAGSEGFAESLSFFPEPSDYRTGPEKYLDYIGDAKRAVSIPLIASLNGSSQGGWVSYARRMEEAGADALELNVYYVPTDVTLSGEDVEQQHVDLVAAVRESISIPLAVKVGPYFSAFANLAKRLVDAGADGLVLFNRYLQPDIDLIELTTKSELELSRPFELLLPLRWAAILRNRVDASLAVTTGIHDGDSLLKALLVGADVGMIASVLLQEGIGAVERILSGLSSLLEAKSYESVDQLKGSMSRENCSDPSAFARGNYMKALISHVGPAI